MNIKLDIYIALYISERRYYRWQTNMDKRNLHHKAMAMVLFDRHINGQYAVSTGALG